MQLRVSSLIVLICIAGTFSRTDQASAQNSSPITLAEVPVMVFGPPEAVAMVYNRPERDYLDYAWRSFVALSWPAKPGWVHRGEPDKSNPVPASRPPVVWETWPYTEDVFLPSGNWGDYPT